MAMTETKSTICESRQPAMQRMRLRMCVCVFKTLYNTAVFDRLLDICAKFLVVIEHLYSC